MKKGQVILLCICAFSMCIVFGIFLGRNLPGFYAITDQNTALKEDNSQTAATNDITKTSSADKGPIDLNAATKAQLMELPGIGEVIAQRILDYRQINGPFATTEDLLNVMGIGEKKLSQIKPFLNIGG